MPRSAEEPEEDEATLRQRRRERILASREQRIAKIMSTASGRTVDPKEVILERTPSPTVSEIAAAGVGPALKGEEEEEEENGGTSGSTNGRRLKEEGRVEGERRRGKEKVATAKAGKSVQSGYFTRRLREWRHVSMIILGGIFFCIWHSHGYRKQDGFLRILPVGAMPWQVLVSLFVALELIELSSRNLVLGSLFGDIALYLFVVICGLRFM